MIKTARAINSNQASQTDKWYRVGTRREREKKVLNLITKVKELNSIEYRSMTEGTLDVRTEWKLTNPALRRGHATVAPCMRGKATFLDGTVGSFMHFLVKTRSPKNIIFPRGRRGKMWILF